MTFSKSSLGASDRYLHPHSSVVIFPLFASLESECAVIPDFQNLLKTWNMENFLWMIRFYPDCNEVGSLEVCSTRISLTSLVRLRKASARWWHGRVSLPGEKEMGMSVKKISLLHLHSQTHFLNLAGSHHKSIH